MEPVSAVLGVTNWLIDKSLKKLQTDLSDAWVGSKNLSSHIKELKKSLLHGKSVLITAASKEIKNEALKEMLRQLKEIAYQAEDLLDELDYFRIQDKVEGTEDAADQVGESTSDTVFHAGQTARHVGNKYRSLCLSCFPCIFAHDDDDDDANNVDMAEETDVSESSSAQLLGARASQPMRTSSVQTPHDVGEALRGLKFPRVEISNRMADISTQLESNCVEVRTYLELEFSSGTPSKATPITPPETFASIPDNVIGRDNTRDEIINEFIINKNFQGKKLSVILISGYGGLGKTTLAKYVYHDQIVQTDFQPIWVCVSLKFNVKKIACEIVKGLPKEKDEQPINETGSLQEFNTLFQKKMKSRKVMLVLDDIWSPVKLNDWECLITLLNSTSVMGNMILVTTRDSSLENMVKPIKHVKLQGLEKDDYWDLFKSYAFPEREMPKNLGNIGRKIVNKLNGNPLAAKTIGRMLRDNPNDKYWVGVLESGEWIKSQEEGDIMPALKISYEQLPFYLQKCFSYCRLFPDDHEFTGEELVYLWMAQGFLSDGGKRMEATGFNYLNQLVDLGFLEKTKDDDTFYAMHDLILEMARLVSSHECLTIDSIHSDFGKIPQTIRHMSIINRSVDDEEMNNEDCFKDKLAKLMEDLKTENLSTLMLFGVYKSSFFQLLRDAFKETKGLRVLNFSTHSCSVESVLCGFSELVHLRYLKLKPYRFDPSVALPQALSRLYHLMVLHLERWNAYVSLPKDMNSLLNLRHFLTNSELHSKIVGIGKLTALQELLSFQVRREDQGFELHQLAKLTELGGSLSIWDLQNVKEVSEAKKAKLKDKVRLQHLSLRWGIEESTNEPTVQEKVLENLQPHSNLQRLGIQGYNGISFPTWLQKLTSLEYLNLQNCERIKCLVLDEQAVEDGGSSSISRPPSGGGHEYGHGDCSAAAAVRKDEEELGLLRLPSNLFNTLRKLEIQNCQNLQITLGKAGGLDRLNFLEKLSICACDKLVVWEEEQHGASHEICLFPSSLKELYLAEMECDTLLLSNLTSLTSLYLRSIHVLRCIDLPLGEGGGWQNIKSLTVERCPGLFTWWNKRAQEAAEKVGSSLSSSSLEHLETNDPKFLTPLICTQLSTSLRSLQIKELDDAWGEYFTEEQERALSLLTSLQCLDITSFRALQCLPAELCQLHSLEILRIWFCGALQSLPAELNQLPSLRDLTIHRCPAIRALPENGLPRSLQELRISGWCSKELMEQGEKLRGTIPTIHIIW